MKTCTLAMLILFPIAASAGSFSKTIAVGGQPDVKVNVRSGDLTITAWDKNEILIESEDNLERFIKADGDQVRIGPENGNRGIDEDLTIRLPAGTQLKASSVSGEVKIQGVNGRIKLGVVSGDVELSSCAGQVSVKSVSGDVEIGKIGDGLTVKAVSGNLKVKDIQGGMLEVKTVSGEINLRNIRTKQVRMKSVSGEIELQGSFPADGQIKASTLSGEVNIILPKGAGFDLEARSRSGSVRTDFELSGLEKSSGKLRGKAGSGGTEIDLNSFSGDLKVTSGK